MKKSSVLLKAMLLLIVASMLMSSACGKKSHTDTETTYADETTVITEEDKPLEEEEETLRPPQNIKNYGIIDYSAGEGLLYNGIKLPDDWSEYAADPNSDEVVIPPYLLSESEGGYRPEVIDITVGRQLFVDDFLIESTDLEAVYHQATKYEGNPIMKPSTTAEFVGSHGTGLAAGGVWYDMEDKKYKMWYDMPFNTSLGYAESDDGITWTRVACNLNGSNVVMDSTLKNGTCSVFIDYAADKSEKYKMFMQSLNNHYATRSKVDGKLYVPLDNGRVDQNPSDVLFAEGEKHLINGANDDNWYAHTLYVSADGINWRQVGGESTGLSGDATTAFYNVFTNKWVNSLRSYTNTYYMGNVSKGRVRYYAEQDNFMGLLSWAKDQAVLWLKCDKEDKIDSETGDVPQMYNFHSIAYESIMFGAWQIWRGPENHVVESTKNPKITEIIASYSRDGFHYYRPDRTALISASRTDGSWDKGYLFASAGALIVHDDEIWIYYSGFSGYKMRQKDGHGTQQIGIAVLRRDGFASMEGKGELTTRTLTVNNGKKYLFVNIDAPADSFKAEIVGSDGKVVEGFSYEDCVAVGGDDTCKMITWKNGKDLSFLNGTEFKIRFSMEQDGEFYSFWLSDSENGESGGAVGAGYASQKRLIK